MYSLTCKHCGLVFNTLHIDKEKGMAEIMTNLSHHFQSRHMAEAKQMGMDVALFNTLSVTVVLMAKHTTLLDQSPEEQIKNPVMEEFGSLLEKIEDCLGVEVNDVRPVDDEDVRQGIDEESNSEQIPTPNLL